MPRLLRTRRLIGALFPHGVVVATTLWLSLGVAQHSSGKLWAVGLSLAVTGVIGVGLDRHLRSTLVGCGWTRIWWGGVILTGLIGLLLLVGSGLAPPLTLAIPFAVAGLFAALAAAITRRVSALSDSGGWERARAAFVVVCALWVVHPFATSDQVGAGDALHYVRQLADFIEQLESGVFPILIGKGSHAFNGDVHPLRTAPLYQYLGALVHLLAGGHGSPFVVHNLLMAGSFLTAVGVTYFSVYALAPTRGWVRLLLCLLVLSSPGFLALGYGGDLIASWITIPFLLLFFFLLIRLAESPKPGSLLWGLAICCAAIWYAHAPIAIWSSAVAAPVAATRMLQMGWSGDALRRVLLACAGFLLLTVFLFVSVSDLEIPRSLAVIQDFAIGGTVSRNLAVGWQGFLRPVSSSGGELLSDLQLSPGLWFALIPAAVMAIRAGRAPAIFMAGFGFLMLLLIPLKEVSGVLWLLVPEALLLPTEKWPMQRFYPIMTAIAAVVAARFLPVWGAWPQVRRVFFALLFVGTFWSLLEAEKFVNRGTATSTPVEVAIRRLLPENSTISRYSHEYFGKPTRYFSNGTMDPAYQMRLLDAATLEPLQSNYDVPSDPDQTIELRVEGHPTGSGRILPNVTLEPGQRYLLTFDFGGSSPSGWIILSGKTLYRDYALPQSGFERAFGAGPESPRSIVVSTSGSEPENIEINYLWNAGPPAAEVFKKIEFGPEVADAVPFRVISLIPFRAKLNGVGQGVVLTPRIYYPGYVAKIDGREVETFPSERRMLLMPVPAGAEELSLTFVGTLRLRVSFWISCVAWLAALLWVAKKGWSFLRGCEPPTRSAAG